MRLTALAFLIVFSASAHCQLTDQQRLDGARSFHCSFPVVALDDWQEDHIMPEVRRQEFELAFEAIDREKHRGKIVGNAGTADVMVWEGEGVLNMIEVTPAGEMNITTVFADVVGGRGFKTVHSRHQFTLGGALPQQMYGYCAHMK